MSFRPRNALAGALVALLPLTGCTITASADRTMSKAMVEQKVADMLEAKVGQRPEAIECPGDLTLKQGQTMVCTLVASNGTLSVDVTVADATKGKERLEIEVGTTVTPKPGATPSARTTSTAPKPSSPAPKPSSSAAHPATPAATPSSVDRLEGAVPQAEVESTIASKWTEAKGAAPQEVTCYLDLAAWVGSKIHCDVDDAAGARHGVTVTVTAIDSDGKVSYDLEQTS